jgi:probable phosphoglycerate mutase
MTGNLFETPESAPEWFTAHCDGGSRGNPGPSGYGAVIEDPHGRTVARLSQFLGVQTNNFAEYSGLLAVLKWAIENRTKCLRVVSDSELMVKQMQGKYKVASPGLRPLFEEARKLSRQLERFEMSHTLRGGNKEADKLANEAMDKGMGRVANATPTANAYAQPPKPENRAVRGADVPNVRPGNSTDPKPPRLVLDGFVKNGVVHPLEGELPDGIFVKIIRE